MAFAGLKIINSDFPLFNVKWLNDDGYEFRPFVHSSLLYLPDGVRYSAGFGLQFLLSGFSFELTLNHSKHKSYDYAPEF